MAMRDDFETRFPNEFTTQELDDHFSNAEKTYMCYFNYVYDPNNTCLQEAILLLVAHLMYINGQSGKQSIRLANSEAVGSVSVSYASSSSDELSSFFKTTKYGQLFLELIRHQKGAVFV